MMNCVEKIAPMVPNVQAKMVGTADRAVPGEVLRRQLGRHRADAAGRVQRDAEDEGDADDLDGAVQDGDLGDALQAAEHVVEGADHGDDAHRDRQVDLQHGGDRGGTADIVADIHQQQRIDHDQRHGQHGGPAVFLRDRAAEMVYSPEL